MPSDATTDSVFVVDIASYFQPIRLPAEGFQRLHAENAERLDEFVEAHWERFPQRARHAGRR
ncbi:MAG: hypothetical protein AAFV43_08980 [Planctomycetota bacterium]